MKYEKQISELFEMLYEDWMNVEDKETFKNELLNTMGETISEINDKIEIGVKNGMSADMQVSILRIMLTKEK